jgi:hypothetical protein
MTAQTHYDLTLEPDMRHESAGGTYAFKVRGGHTRGSRPILGASPPPGRHIHVPADCAGVRGDLAGNPPADARDPPQRQDPGRAERDRHRQGPRARGHVCSAAQRSSTPYSDHARGARGAGKVEMFEADEVVSIAFSEVGRPPMRALGRTRARGRQDLEAGKVKLEIHYTGVLNDQLKGFYRSNYKLADGTPQVPRRIALAAACPHPGRSTLRCPGLRCCRLWLRPSSSRRWPAWRCRVGTSRRSRPRSRSPCASRPTSPRSPTCPSRAPPAVTQPPATAPTIVPPCRSESVGADGLKTVVFSKSPVMSTYLLAFMVGHFEMIEETDANGVLIRACTREAVRLRVAAVAHARRVRQASSPRPARSRRAASPSRWRSRCAAVYTPARARCSHARRAGASLLLQLL